MMSIGGYVSFKDALAGFGAISGSCSYFCCWVVRLSPRQLSGQPESPATSKILSVSEI